MKLQNLILMTLGLAFALIVRLAEAADYQSAEFIGAYQQFMQVSDDEGGSAKKLSKRWEHIVAADESDPFALVMLGSSHTLQGRDALMPWSKLNHTEKGLDEMTLALRLLNDTHRDITFQGMSITHHVQSMAAITFTQVPEFFGRWEDGLFLFEDLLTDADFHALPAEAQTFVFYYAIAAAKQLGQIAQTESWLDDLLALQVQDDFSSAAMALE